MTKRKRSSRKRISPASLDPDEIFLDSENLPEFDTQQFEGRLEKPIRKNTIHFLGIFFAAIMAVFIFRAANLQIIHGDSFFSQSQNNNLSREPIFADRGIIYDRNHKELVSNDQNKDNELFSHRTYPADPGFSNLLGYVSYPLKDKDGFYWQSDFVGKAGIEEEYDDSLKGANGTQVIERDAFGHVISENTTNPPVQGNNLTLTIDADVQSNLYEKMDAVAHANNYQGGAGIMIDIHTGEIIALTSYPEYNSEILSEGIDTPVIQGYLNDPQKPFLNRAIDGLYSPGSIFKPIVALGALKEGVIDPLTKLLSFGSISVPNPYAPGQNTIFKDYAADNGLVDMRNALRVSSNIYFYEIGGGYKSQKGIGIANIQKYAAMFGLGAPSGIDLPDEKAGVIPGPEWKALHFPGDPWRIGDTYHTAIGQYGVQVTPIQMARVVSAIANGGTLVTPHVVIDPSIPIPAPAKLPFPDSDFNVIREGMRLVATVGTAKSFNNLPFKLAAKTGTAQVGVNNEFINSWTMTFFPYDAPRYALVVMMERGPATNTVGSQLAAHDFLDWLGTYKPEYVSVK